MVNSEETVKPEEVVSSEKADEPEEDASPIAARFGDPVPESVAPRIEEAPPLPEQPDEPAQAPQVATIVKGETMASDGTDSTPPTPPTLAPPTLAPSPQTPAAWTPELWMQLFKEIVTALLGLILVIAAVMLAFRNYALLDNPITAENADYITQQVAWAKDVLIIVIGLVGVVLGYYFGRVPADARAAQAQKETAMAVSHAQDVSTQAEALESQLDKVIESATPVPAADGSRGAADARNAALNSELLRLREQLRNLARSARR